jgi:hypothetical protein
MVCATQRHAFVNRFRPVEAPSLHRIKQLTAEIRETWSPQTRASRAVNGASRVEIMMISVRDICDRGRHLDH